MRDNGRSKRFALSTWTGAALLLALAVVGGASLLSGTSEGVLAVTLAIAGWSGARFAREHRLSEGL